MYLRESRRRNKDGSTVSYLQLAHNERHPESGSPVAKVIHNFGRADKVDREALSRLVRSISRVLEVTVYESFEMTLRCRPGPWRLPGRADL